MSIYLGLTDLEKDAEIVKYCSANDIKKVVIFAPEKYHFDCTLPAEIPHEHVKYEQIIKYIFYYRLLQEVDNNTLLVVNELFRDQDRNNLTYNCLRSYLAQTKHQLIFQYLPLIDTEDDFMTLFDFDTKSRWKREKLRPDLFKEADIHVREIPLTLLALQIETDAKTKADYAREKRKLIDEIGLKDPHTIPRQLHLLSGKAKFPYVSSTEYFVARNARFKASTITTYKEDKYPRQDYNIFEFCHNFIDFVDVASLSRQVNYNVLVSDLKVDQWYFQRYESWLGRLRNAYSILRG